jgi:IMP cyclohydrolase
MNANNVLEHISNNSYPGRGIVLGRNLDGMWIAIYWIMGRSDNSRNRIFTYKNNILSTEAADPSLVEDPSLIIYNAMRDIGHNIIVTNGSQTDIIYDKLMLGSSFMASLEDETFEPDAPNYTPRISGYVNKNEQCITLSIIKRNFTGDTDHCYYRYSKLPAGVGYCITTYMGDGDPLPSFHGDPILFPFVKGNAKEIANTYWNELDADNRVSLMARVNNNIEIINGENK